MIEIEALDKTFILHTRGGTTLPVLHGLGLTVAAGECVALYGPSGVGKSTLLRCIYANYKAQGGRILVRHGDETVDMARAEPRKVLEIRRATVGYVSQFLRVIPRVPTLDIVAEPLKATGVPVEDAQARARELLTRLRIPERLWSVPPATFSGGEQQRVNLARGFVVDYPIMLLDEPTAALDARNRESVVGLINQARDRGTAIVGIFHDQEVRTAVATRIFDIEAEGVAA